LDVQAVKLFLAIGLGFLTVSSLVYLAVGRLLFRRFLKANGIEISSVGNARRILIDPVEGFSLIGVYKASVNNEDFVACFVHENWRPGNISYSRLNLDDASEQAAN